MASLLNSKILHLISLLLVTIYVKLCLASPEACKVLDGVRSTYMSPANKLGMPGLMVSTRMKKHAGKLLAQKLVEEKTALQGEDSIMVLTHSTLSDNPLKDGIQHFSRLAGLRKPENFVNKIKVTPTGKYYWTESEVVGKGSFGEVRIGTSGTEGGPLPDQELFAVKFGKLESSSKEGALEVNNEIIKGFEREKEVYADVTTHNIDGIYPLEDAGKCEGIPVLVMKHFPANLNELRVACGGNFTLKGIVPIISAMVDILWDLHLFGWIHRDIKPANIMVEMQDAQRKSKLVLIDLGLAERYLNKDDNKPFKNEPTAESGTPAFMSILTHQHNGPNRREDLEPLLYSILEFFRGKISWGGEKNLERFISHKTKFFRDEDIIKPFNSMKSHIEGLDFDSAPHYSYIQQTLEEILETHDLNDGGQFDWDIKLNALFLDRNVIAVGVECVSHEERNHCVFVFEKFYDIVLSKINQIRGKKNQVLITDVLNEKATKLAASASEILHIQCAYFTTLENNLIEMDNFKLKSFPAEKYKQIRKVLKIESTLYVGFGYNSDNGKFTVGVIFMTGIQFLYFKNGVTVEIPFPTQETNSLNELAERYCFNRAVIFRKHRSWDVIDVEIFEYEFSNILSYEVCEHKIENTKFTPMEGLDAAFKLLPFAKINCNEFPQIGYATKYIRQEENRHKHLIVVFKLKKYFHEALQLLNSCATKLKLPKITCSIDEDSKRENTGIQFEYFTSTGNNLEEACSNAVPQFVDKFLKKLKGDQILNVTFYWKPSTNSEFDIGIARDSYTVTFIKEFTTQIASQPTSKTHLMWTYSIGSETLRIIANSCALKMSNNMKISAEIGLCKIQTTKKTNSDTVHGRVLNAVSELIEIARAGPVENFDPNIAACFAFGYHVALDGSINAIAVVEYFWHPTFKKINFIRKHSYMAQLNLVFCVADSQKKVSTLSTTVKATNGEGIKDILHSFVENIWEKKKTSELKLLLQPGTGIHFAVEPIPCKKRDVTKEWRIEIITLE